MPSCRMSTGGPTYQSRQTLEAPEHGDAPATLSLAETPPCLVRHRPGSLRSPPPYGNREASINRSGPRATRRYHPGIPRFPLLTSL